MPRKKYTMNAINRDALLTFIAPEVYSYRTPLPNPARTAVGRSSLTFTVTVNGGGMAALVVYPNNAFGLSATAPFINECHTLAFNPVTGVGVFTPYDGPFASMIPFIASYATTAFSY